jgi:hypothetical protein
MPPKSNLLHEYFQPETLAAELDVCTKTLDRWKALGIGPPVTKIGRKTYYSRTGVTVWLQEQEQESSARKRVA